MEAIQPRAGVSRIPRIERPGSWTVVVVSLYTLFIVGRIQEIFPSIGALRIPLLLGGLIVAAWIAGPGSFQEKLGLERREVRWVLLLVGLAVFTLPLAVWPRQAFVFLTDAYSKIVLLFLVILYVCRSLADQRKVLWMCCLGPVVLVVHGILTGTPEDRFAGDAKAYDPNDLAFVLVVILPLILYLLANARAPGKLLASLMVVLCLYGVVLTQSRGGFLALVVVALIILRRSTMSRSGKALVLGLGLVVFGALAGNAYWDRMETIWAPKTEYDRSGNERTRIWATALTLIATRPWGAGIGCAATAEGLSHEVRAPWMTAHNSFLQIGIELGVAGLAVFVALLAGVMRHLRKMQTLGPPGAPLEPDELRAGSPKAGNPPVEVAPLAAALETSLWGYLVAGFFLSQAYSYVLYVVLGLSVACSRMADDGGPAGKGSKARAMKHRAAYRPVLARAQGDYRWRGAPGRAARQTAFGEPE